MVDCTIAYKGETMNEITILLFHLIPCHGCLPENNAPDISKTTARSLSLCVSHSKPLHDRGKPWRHPGTLGPEK